LVGGAVPKRETGNEPNLGRVKDPTNPEQLVIAVNHQAAHGMDIRSTIERRSIAIEQSVSGKDPEMKLESLDAFFASLWEEIASTLPAE
jgi:hypothetical protein